MTFAAHALPPEAEDPPPTRRDLLRDEREALIAQVRPRIRSNRQERIRRRIAEVTMAMIREERRDESARSH